MIFFSDLGGLQERFGVADGHEIISGYGGQVLNIKDVALVDSNDELLVDLLDQLGELVN